MADRYLLESGAPDGYQKEDATGVLLLEVPDCYYNTVIADTPVAYWRLGESAGTNANDEIGILDGTYVGTPTLGATGPITGDGNTAITVNGTTQYVTVPDNAVIDFGDGPFSVELWFKRTGNYGGTYSFLLSKGSQGGLSFTADDKLLWDNDGSVSARSSTAYASGDNAWHHVVATHKPPGAAYEDRLYVDGVDVTTAWEAHVFTANATTLHIGAYPGGSSFFAGSIDEVALYDKILTPTQVATHYAAATAACVVPRVPYTNPMPPLIAQ